MHSARSSKNEVHFDDRVPSPLPVKRSDHTGLRPLSPTTSSILSSRSSLLRKNNDLRRSLVTPPKDRDVEFHRAAFVRCTPSKDGNFIENPENLQRALNYVGHDLQRSRIDELWAEHDRIINFEKFQAIIKQEKFIDERMLREAFESLYPKDKKTVGHMVDFDRFRQDLLEKGDSFTEQEFEAIRTLLFTKEGKIDLQKLTKSIEETKEKCRQRILNEKREQAEDDRDLRVNASKSRQSKNTTDIRIEPNQDNLNIPAKTKKRQMKGAFFCEDDPQTGVNYYSIGYEFEIEQETPVWIIIEPELSSFHTDMSMKQIDARLLLFKQDRITNRRRLIQISTERSDNKSYLFMKQLEAGFYEIVPITFGAVLQSRSQASLQKDDVKKLRKSARQNGYVMTDDYRNALSYVFSLFDLDNNKQLDRDEFALWTQRTSGQDLTDEDWQLVRENLQLDIDENISEKKFIHLNEFEVREKETSETDLWKGLMSVGFNQSLEIDKMCPFTIVFHSQLPEFHLKPTSFVTLSELKSSLMKFLKEKTFKYELDRTGIECLEYQDNCGCIVFVHNSNTSPSQITTQVIKSRNAALNIEMNPRKPSVIRVPAEKSEIIAFVHRLDSHQAMELTMNMKVE